MYSLFMLDELRCIVAYLDGLARKFRCFPRCPYALRCAIRLFAFCFHSRQLYKQRYPYYPAHVIDLVSPLQ